MNNLGAQNPTEVGLGISLINLIRVLRKALKPFSKDTWPGAKPYTSILKQYKMHQAMLIRGEKINENDF